MTFIVSQKIIVFLYIPDAHHEPQNQTDINDMAAPNGVNGAAKRTVWSRYSDRKVASSL